MAAMVNMNTLLNGKDSRWLQLEVCREFQRNKCSRQDTECKFAHPPANVEVQNGKVTACYDSIKGRCNRDKPPCKYFHPPQHLKDQLLINGRNHLALKNALMQQMGIAPGQPVMPGQVQTVATNPYLTGIPANTYSPYFAPGHLVPALLGPDPSAVASQLGPVVSQTVPVAQQKIPRSDRLEVCREFMRGACKRIESECRFAHPQESVTTHEDGSVTVCMDAVKGRCARDPCRYFHPPLHLQAQIKAAQSRATSTATVSAATLTHHISTPGAAHPPNAVAIGHPLEVGKKRAAENDMFQLMDVKTVGSFYYENFAFSGMVPYKRPAAEKSGIPVYQPGATTYQQLMQLQQPFVPVSSSSKIPLNASYVIYTDANGQLLDTLPVCQDFNRSLCSRLNCRFVHLTEDDKVEVCDQRVAVCRDHANGQCRRKQCKYYHIPVALPPAHIMATIFNKNSQQPQQQQQQPSRQSAQSLDEFMTKGFSTATATATTTTVTTAALPTSSLSSLSTTSSSLSNINYTNNLTADYNQSNLHLIDHDANDGGNRILSNKNNKGTSNSNPYDVHAQHMLYKSSISPSTFTSTSTARTSFLSKIHPLQFNHQQTLNLTSLATAATTSSPLLSISTSDITTTTNLNSTIAATILPSTNASATSAVLQHHFYETLPIVASSDFNANCIPILPDDNNYISMYAALPFSKSLTQHHILSTDDLMKNDSTRKNNNGGGGIGNATTTISTSHSSPAQLTTTIAATTSSRASK